jgi:hypothetical protein
MRYDEAMCQWRCAGFDGEGCDRVVTDEEIEWRHLGRIGPVSVAGITIVEDPAQPPGEALFFAGRRPVKLTMPLPERAPWADPGHDVAGDLRDAADQAGKPFADE